MLLCRTTSMLDAVIVVVSIYLMAAATGCRLLAVGWADQSLHWAQSSVDYCYNRSDTLAQRIFNVLALIIVFVGAIGNILGLLDEVDLRVGGGPGDLVGGGHFFQHELLDLGLLLDELGRADGGLEAHVGVGVDLFLGELPGATWR